MYVLTLDYQYESAPVKATSRSVAKLIKFAKETNIANGTSYDININIEGHKEYIMTGATESYDTYEICKVKHI